MSEIDQWIRDHVECCSCREPMWKSNHINMVQTERRATWKYPTAGNILTGEPCVRAVAIVCDRCIRHKNKPMYAVEWNNEHTYVKYHLLATLEATHPTGAKEPQ